MSDSCKQHVQLPAQRFGLAHRTRFLRRSAIAFVVVAMLILLCGCRSARRRGTPIKNFAVTDVRAQMQFELQVREEKRDAPGTADDEEISETILEESLKLDVDGYVYHPNFLEFAAGMVLGLRHYDFGQTIAGRASDDRKDGSILEYDLTGTLFRKKAYPLTFFARRGRSLDPRPFRSSIETTTQSVGVTWRYASKKTPALLRFSNTQVEFDPFLLAGEVAGRREDTNLRLDASYIISDHNKLRFVYDHRRIAEEPFDIDYTTDEIILSHRLGFGPKHRHRLDSEVYYTKQRGTFDSDSLRWVQTLSLQHTDDLRTWYQLEYNDRSQGSVSNIPTVNEKSHRFVGLLEHKLYESLVSQFTVRYQNQDFDSGLTIERFGGDARFDYRKKNPWGRLRMNLGIRHDRVERSRGDIAFEAIDERHIFTDEPIVLREQNIVLGSIRILREDRTQQYQPGRDYRVRFLGTRTEIERVFTGRIRAGETVLLTYRFGVVGAMDIEAFGVTFGARQELNSGITPYYAYRKQNQTVTARRDTGGFIPEDIRSHVVGVEYRNQALRLIAEYEDHDSTRSPYVSKRISANYSRRLASGATLGLSARWSDVQFRGIGPRSTERFIAEASYRHSITRDLTFDGAVMYLDQSDTFSGNDKGVDVDLSLEWFVRQTEFRIGYTFGTFRNDFADQKSTMLTVQIRRQF